MRKMYKHTLSLCLALLVFALTACGGYEDFAPEASPGYEADAQVWETEGSETDAPASLETEGSETDAPASLETDVPTAPQEDEDVSLEPQEDTDGLSEPDMSASPGADVITDLPAYGSYYYDLENVVLYLEVYDELPPNYITKSEARKLGWEGGSVEKYKEGAAIGGDSFGNREGLLPEADGRSYTECDIDTDGYDSRGSRRLVFSNDGLYFYTSDHYETFSEVTVTEDYEVVW